MAEEPFFDIDDNGESSLFSAIGKRLTRRQTNFMYLYNSASPQLLNLIEDYLSSKVDINIMDMQINICVTNTIHTTVNASIIPKLQQTWTFLVEAGRGGGEILLCLHYLGQQVEKVEVLLLHHPSCQVCCWGHYCLGNYHSCH